MKVLIVGAGALGSLVGGLLSRDNDVTIIGRQDQVEVINSSGIRIEGFTQGSFHPRALTDPPRSGRFDLIVICIKSYNTERALGPLSHLMGDGTYVLSLQNGLDNEERIARFIREKDLDVVLFGGITCHGVTYKEPGLVKHAGVGDTMVGIFDNPRQHEAADGVISVADLFRRAGIEMDVKERIDREIWAKALINSAINPLTAIKQDKNGIIIDDPNMTDLASRVIGEGVSIAIANGIDLTYDEVLQRTLATARRTCGNHSSMLQDIRRRRRTEIEAINGALVRKAELVGMEAPYNRTLYDLVRSVEDSYLDPPTGNP